MTGVVADGIVVCIFFSFFFFCVCLALYNSVYLELEGVGFRV